MLGDVRRVLAGKKPHPRRMARAGAVAARAATRAVVLGPMAASPTAAPFRRVRPRRRSGAGNLLLMVAIAVLVGLATFVLVRERLGDETQPALGRLRSRGRR